MTLGRKQPPPAGFVWSDRPDIEAPDTLVCQGCGWGFRGGWLGGGAGRHAAMLAELRSHAQCSTNHALAVLCTRAASMGLAALTQHGYPDSADLYTLREGPDAVRLETCSEAGRLLADIVAVPFAVAQDVIDDDGALSIEVAERLRLDLDTATRARATGEPWWRARAELVRAQADATMNRDPVVAAADA